MENNRPARDRDGGSVDSHAAQVNRPTREVPAHKVPAPPEDGRLRLLLVEDDDSLRNVLVRTLSDAFDITAVANGASAAALLMQKAYDVILSDINLPGTSGIDLLRLVRTYDFDIAVVLMTGEPTVDTAVAALELGAFTYLQKPFDTTAARDALVRAGRLTGVARMKRKAAEAGIGGSCLASDHVGLGTTLDSALESLYLVFQPIVNRWTQKTMGYEALMRTHEASMPSPGDVLEAAERLGRIHDVGRRVREVAAASFEPPSADTLLFVNLHTADLSDASLYALDAPLAKMAKQVILEVTERAVIDEVAKTRKSATDLRFRGFRVAIDDLGAGYAGLTSFATLEPEIVKLDMSLIRGIDSSPMKAHIVESVTRMCREVNVRVVAEGIETGSELARVIEIGCDYLQGYFLGRPAPTLTPSTRHW